MKPKAIIRGMIALTGFGLTMLLGVPGISQAGGVQPDYKASPDIYKVIAENDKMRVILATWPAGSKDNMHSHPKSFAIYRLKDCDNRITKADGTFKVNHLKAGTAVVKDPVKAHVPENIGTTACQNVLVELK